MLWFLAEPLFYLEGLLNILQKYQFQKNSKPQPHIFLYLWFTLLTPFFFGIHLIISKKVSQWKERNSTPFFFGIHLIISKKVSQWKERNLISTSK
jgi:hypothetical protein